MIDENKKNGSIYKLKDRIILSPSLDPSRQGREDFLLPLDGGGRVGVKDNYPFLIICI
jgi:hypothetical protein